MGFRRNLRRSMGVRLPGAILAKQILRRSVLTANITASASAEVPKRFLAVYVGQTEKKRFVVPVSYLSHSSVQDLLRKAEEEFGFDHPMDGLTIPCREDFFVDVTSQLNRS
ncbi:auxin-responsive protein SAUR21-like [Ricinus communis]|uniref:auxin-responsive protein SAUR21-like n=1 Tax=Ricinus communis TaxID=3988 RepID=UPI000D6909CF|nr:auxin-responsive protein SAUR21-like [Ricinus communis]|eukprot:XP_025013865.1 auxin-responsive protein SAUR21-like [Ricinus communis]